MTWYCQACRVQNGPRLETCKQCGLHWEKVWAPPKKKSRSKSRSQTGNSYVKETKVENQSEAQWEVFPAKAPWITTTPSRSTTYRTDAMQMTAEKSLAPTAQAFPLQTPPTAEASDLHLTPEEAKKLEHLRGLRNIGVELSAELAADLEALQVKEEKAASVKVLISDLDAEWSKFMINTTEKIKEHAKMYQTCRSDLLENYNEKLQELFTIKQEVGRASQSLIAQTTDQDVLPSEAPMIEEQLLQMQEMMSQASQVGGIVDLTEDLDMDQDEEAMEDNVPLSGSIKKGSPRIQKTFRSATSPSKVAQQHLKPSTQAVREAKAKEKEDK
eukprot:s2365_g8.t1